VSNQYKLKVALHSTLLHKADAGNECNGIAPH
jgi:hypothetical protein